MMTIPYTPSPLIFSMNYRKTKRQKDGKTERQKDGKTERRKDRKTKMVLIPPLGIRGRGGARGMGVGHHIF